MRTRLNKRPFTLVEMLVVIVLIAVAAGAMAPPLSKALQGERFERGVDGVIAKIALAQEIMLDFRTNLVLTLEQKEGMVYTTLEADIPLPERLEKGLNLHPKISGITAMAFEGEIKEKIDLFFDGSLGTIQEGELTLRGGLQREQKILLQGYPGHIRRGKHGQTLSCTASYPEEIVSAL